MPTKLTSTFLFGSDSSSRGNLLFGHRTVS